MCIHVKRLNAGSLWACQQKNGEYTGTIAFYSYGTPIALFVPKNAHNGKPTLYRSKENFSPTTTRHHSKVWRYVYFGPKGFHDTNGYRDTAEYETVDHAVLIGWLEIIGYPTTDTEINREKPMAVAKNMAGDNRDGIRYGNRKGSDYYA